MSSQRVGLMALRRASVKPTAGLLPSNVARAMVLRSAMAIQTRPFTVEKYSQDQANHLLASQRLHRPVSPHMTIYDPAQVWFGVSIMQRFTGMLLSGSLYAGTLAYLAAPALGWHLESASLVSVFAGLPLVAKGALKVLYAWPFVFHALNGIRHLVWDTAVVGITKPEIRKVSNIIWGLSVALTVGIVAFY